jgi:hypothetical protein
MNPAEASRCLEVELEFREKIAELEAELARTIKMTEDWHQKWLGRAKKAQR